MKLAILGTGPMAMELALFFHNEGAMVKMIGPQNPGGKIQRLALAPVSSSIELKASGLSPWGIEFTQYTPEQSVSYREIWDNYYSKISTFLKTEKIFIPRELIRVQKQFLHTDEEIKGRTRLLDLFRVTYGLNASGLVEEQLAENPELADKIGADILESLKNQVESFEDFDLVVDCRGPFQTPLRIGAGGDFALNERPLGELGLIEYGHDFIKESDTNLKTLTLVGDDQLAAFQLVLLEQWLEVAGHELNIVTHHQSAFEIFLADKDQDSWLQDRVRSIITKYMKNWRAECEAVEKKILEWRELEPHMKAKVSKPVFPEPKIKLYESYTITSVDKLTDRDQVFLTLELPLWKNEGNERRDLITLAQDRVIASCGFEEDHAPIKSLKRVDNEPGFLTLDWSNQRLNLDNGLESIEKIIDQVFTYFSKG